MTATGKNIYYDVLDDVVNKHNNTKHSTIKLKPIDVKDNNKRVKEYILMNIMQKIVDLK